MTKNVSLSILFYIDWIEQIISSKSKCSIFSMPFSGFRKIVKLIELISVLWAEQIEKTTRTKQQQYRVVVVTMQFNLFENYSPSG